MAREAGYTLAFFIATSQRRNRWKACQELGIEPKLKEWDGKGSLVSFVVSLNLKRRHLTPSQGAAVAVEAKPFYDAEAKERQREAGKTYGKGKGDEDSLLKNFSKLSDDEKEQSKGRLLLRSFNDPNLSDEEKEELSQIPYRLTPAEKAVMAVRVLPELEEASDKKWAKRVANSLMASTQVAKQFNTNASYVNQAENIKAQAPDIFEEIKAGSVSIPDAKREVKKRQQKKAREEAIASSPEIQAKAW